MKIVDLLQQGENTSIEFKKIFVRPENLLKNTDILTEQYQATVAGLLVFALNPQKFIPNACISFAHFAGDEITEELIDKQTITGTLDIQVDSALAIIKNNIQRPSLITKVSEFILPSKKVAQH